MTRLLVLIRHTKSDWTDFTIADFERPLKKDRLNDPRKVSSALKQMKLAPDLIIASPSVRTRQTAKYFCDALNYSEDKIEFEPTLYESTASQYLKIIAGIPKEINTLIIVGHNPSITDLASTILQRRIEHVPTTGVVGVEFDKEDWLLDDESEGKLKFFLSPKTIQ